MSMPCPSSNPCNCLKGIYSTKASTPVCGSESTKCPGTCLLACSDILSCQEAIGPCGQTGTFDLKTLNHNLSGLLDPTQAKWSLENKDYEDVFLSASLDRNTGILTWITKGPETVGKFAEFCFAIEGIAACDECTLLKDVGNFVIGVKDECKAHSCLDKCEECDPCSGDCIDNSGSIKIEG